MAIRVEAREVVVPVFVIDKSDIREKHLPGAGTTYEEFDKEITGLSLKDFQVFEDGRAQRIQNLAIEPWAIQTEDEFSPRGIWSRPGLPSQNHADSVSLPLHAYLISYVPPQSSEGACHQIKVKVNHRHATVSAREEYCNTKYPTSDPMTGTKLGKEMESFANSEEVGKLPISVQAGCFVGSSSANRVDIAVEFPSSVVKREWHNTHMDVTIAVVGLVYNEDKTLALRFSDIWSTLPVDFYRGEIPPPLGLKEFESATIPSRYETQVGLPTGDFDLKLVVTDGKKFGRVDVPICADKHDRQSLAVSDIVLCKWYRKAPNEPRGPDQAPQYIPLTSNGLEFIPAGDTRFKRGQRLMTYFEIYEPMLGRAEAVNLQFQMRVTGATTGEIKTATGLRAVQSGIRLGNPIIPLAEEIAVDKLPAGDYRVEVQVSDSAGNKTVWHSASFTIE